MPFTVANVYQLKKLSQARILTGESGFHRVVSHMSILDYEFMIGTMKGAFIENDFVLSSFLFAKDDPELLRAAIRTLIEYGVSLLGIKDVYYKQLPQDIIDYAIAHDFSIFLFGGEAYFEDIITEVTDTIRLMDSNQLIEFKLGTLLETEVGKSVVRELSLEINPQFRENVTALCCKPLVRAEEADQFRTLNRLQRLSYFQDTNSVFQYKNFLLAILTSDAPPESRELKKIVREFMERTGITTSEYVIGTSDSFPFLHQLNLALRESLYACQIGGTQGKGLCFYQEIGLYKILLPHLNSFWTDDFRDSVLTPLTEYDRHYSTELFITLRTYVDQGGSIKKTAAALFQHDNTIRYRLNKIRELLHMERDNDFDTLVSIAMRLYQLQTLD